MSALDVHRFHFGFTITFHYLFPQLTMGLALLIVVLKILAIRSNAEIYHRAARFWGKIFGINFLMGVITGIPMEFQFGTNFAAFSKRTGEVIAQPLMMEGIFSFFLESTFLGLFLYGERRLSRLQHLGSAILVWLGSWLSGYFIIVSNGWMQHPVGSHMNADGKFVIDSFLTMWTNPWAILQYMHTMCGAVVTASFVLSATGAYYLLEKKFTDYARVFLKVGVIAGCIACVFMIFPTGDLHARYLAKHQPATAAAIEGIFKTQQGAPLTLIGQPDPENQRIDNPIAINKAFSLLSFSSTTATVKGLDAFPKSEHPTNIPLLYYSYHIMAGLGTIMVAVMGIAMILLLRKKLFLSRWILWILMLCVPFPYIANTAGWMTAELGRQPYIIYKYMRTSEGVSPLVSSGNALFSLLGFMGLYLVIGLLFVLLIYKQIDQGPPAIEKKTIESESNGILAAH